MPWASHLEHLVAWVDQPLWVQVAACRSIHERCDSVLVFQRSRWVCNVHRLVGSRRCALVWVKLADRFSLVDWLDLVLCRVVRWSAAQEFREVQECLQI